MDDLRNYISERIQEMLNEETAFKNTVKVYPADLVKFVKGFFEENDNVVILTDKGTRYKDPDKFKVNFNNMDMERDDIYYGVEPGAKEAIWKYYPEDYDLLTDLTNREVWDIIRNR